MEKVISISLNQTLYTLEEPAYALLEAYLSQVKSAFSHTDGGLEIVQDIEARIAEHFKNLNKNPLIEKHVQDILHIMGPVQSFTEHTEPSKERHTQTSPTPQKKLFRDVDNAIIGGVCGGIGAYTEVDPTWIRIGFIALALFGFGLIIPIYIILWIILPGATTTASKIEMRGDPVTISNIAETVKQRIDELKDREHDAAKKTEHGIRAIFQKIKEVVRACMPIAGKIIRISAHALRWVIGLVLLIASLGLILSVIIAISTSLSAPYPAIVLSFLSYLNTPSLVSFFVATLGIAFLIPLFFVAYGSLRMLSTTHIPKARFKLILFMFWTLSVFVVIGIGTFFFIHFLRFATFTPELQGVIEMLRIQ